MFTARIVFSRLKRLHFTNESATPIISGVERKFCSINSICAFLYVFSKSVSASGYDAQEVTGKYYLINQGTGIDAEIAQPVMIYLLEDGSVRGENVDGVWEKKEDSYYMSITLGEKKYSGVFCQMKDEAGTDVMTFSAVGANESVWGVKY